MNDILRQYKKEDKIILSKYMDKTKNLYPEVPKLKSIIKSNLENEDSIMNSTTKKKEHEIKIKYDQGITKKNRIKFYKELNPDLLKEDERKRRNLLIEKRNQAKKKINVKKLEKFFKRNEQELLDNILLLEQKKLIPTNEESESNNKEINTKDKNKEQILTYNIKQLYLFGNNFSNNNIDNKNLFAYHKKDRWICFPNSDSIIVDQFIDFNNNDSSEDDNSNHNDLIKKQIILNKHKNKSYINKVKISPHGNVVYFINEEKYIIFYRYDYQKKKFEYISELNINYNEKINDFIIEQNEIFCLVLYDNYHFLVIDFFSNEEVLYAKINYLEQNIFYDMILNNFTEYKIEFCFCSNDSYKIYKLQYIDEIKLIEEEHYMKFDNKKIISFEFLPAIGYTATLCLLISFEDKNLYLINGDLNEIIHIYNFDFIVNKIICSLFFINLISDISIKFYPLSNTKNILLNDMKDLKHDILNENIKKEIKHESKIISTEIDINDSTGRALLFTERGYLYYDFYPERKKIKLYGFNSEEKYITNCLVIKNYSSDISEIKKNSHFIVTSLKGGYIKIISIPSFDLIYEFREKNAEINYLLSIPDKTLFLIFYDNGLMKCFDTKKCKFTGIINISEIIGVEDNKKNLIKYAKFYEGGRFCIFVDEFKCDLYLITFDSYEPLTIKSKQIPYIRINGLDKIFINRVEPFYTFGVSNNLGQIFIYERKYANLIQSLNLENDTPIYEIKDYLNMNEIKLAEFKLKEDSINLCQNENKINNNEIYYGLRIKDIDKEKHYLYIFNYKYNVLYVRDCKNKIMVDAIQINSPVYNFVFEKNIQDNVFIMNKDGIQKFKIMDLTSGNVKYKGIEWLPKMKKFNGKENENKMILSEDGKLVLISNHNCFSVYLVTK